MRTLLFALIAIALPALAAAQVDRATLTGVVRDPSNAAVAGATVTVTHITTGVDWRVLTSDEGTYLVVNLPPGEVIVEAEAPGFQRFVRTVLLAIGNRVSLDLTLPVGAVTETVQVQGVTPLLDTQSPVVGSVVSQTEVANLPLSNRNWDDLLFTIPGVQGDRYTEQTGTTNAGRTGGVSVHGNRSLQNNFLLDGVDNNSISTNVQELSTQVSRPSIDSIGEFKVVTSPFTAEYGRAPGGAIVVTTKSGTNQIRGTAYDYFRNDRFDSITFFAKRANQAKAANDQNQFGANIGGPILENRAFFFFDVEATRITQGVLRTGRVATADERNGIFSSTIRDPLTGLPFANNTIPQFRIDPIARELMALVPMPNAASTSNNFIRQPNVEDDGERYLLRTDFRPGSNDNIFVRYIFTDRTRFVPGFFGGVLDGTSTSAWGRNFLKSHSTVAGWTSVVSSSLVNEFRLSWARGVSDGQQDPFGNVGLQFPGVPNNPAVAGGVIGVDITGHLRLGSPNFMPKYQHTNSVQYLNTTTWLKGNHALKFGTDIMSPMNNEYVDIPSTRGNLSFTGQFTGNAIADFLLGYARGAELSNVHLVNQRRYAYAFFVQDDWRASQRLTLNLGFRYDFMTPSFERDNLMANFDPATGALRYASDGSLADRALLTPDRNNFGPRVGFVYQLNERTLLRGGYGRFFNPLDRIGSEDQLALNPPNLRNINQTTTSTTTPVLLLRDGFPANYLDPSNIVLSRLLIRAANPSGENASFDQFSLGTERQVANDFVVSADVIGNFGRNIAVLRNLNQPLNGNGARPYPNFSHIQWRDPAGTSKYYGVDFAAEKRFSRGLSYRVAYTLSNAKDQAPEHLAASSGRPQDTNDIEAWEGPSDFDVRHRLVGNFVAQLPFGADGRFVRDGVAGAILGGWTVSGIYTARSGRPFTVTQGSLEGATWLPNTTGDPQGAESVDQWFNPAAFARVAAGVFGNSGRNSLTGPGYMTFDMSVQRRIPATGRVGVTLRWDVFNLFNRANLGNPNSDITAANAGSISTLAGDPRVMQFAVRLTLALGFWPCDQSSLSSS
jgi:outer membrane receptor protein involved in Fe transport